MADPQSFERLRPLGYLETYSSSRHHLGFYNNVAVSAVYNKPSVRASAPLQPLVFHALATVISQHPQLSAIPVDADKARPYFARLPKINLEDAVTFTTHETTAPLAGEEFDRFLERQHNLNFKHRYGELPFWRLIILYSPSKPSNFVASFVYHHAIADGQSGMSFHRSFLAALIEAENVDLSAKPPALTISPSAGPLTPSCESSLNLTPTFCFLIRALIKDKFPPKLTSTWLAGPITADESKRQTKLHSLCLSRETTERLARACREHSTTVTAALSSLLAASIFFHLPEKYTQLICHGPMSMRRFIPPDSKVTDDSMGVWVSRWSYHHQRYSPPSRTNKEKRSPSSLVSWLMSYFSLSRREEMHVSGTDDSELRKSSAKDPFSWKEAQDVRAAITKELEKKGRDAPVGLLRYAGPLNEWFMEQMGSARGASFEVSNVGVWKNERRGSIGEKGAPEGTWKVGRMVFSQCADVTGVPFCASFVTGGDGDLTLSVAWLSGILEEVWVKTVMGTFEKLVGEISSTETETESL